MNASLIGLFGTLAALLAALAGAAYIVVKDYDESAEGYKQLQKLNTTPASNLELLIREYMDRDLMDPSATIDFILAADLLTNPFAPHDVLTVYAEDHIFDMPEMEKVWRA